MQHSFTPLGQLCHQLNLPYKSKVHKLAVPLGKELGRCCGMPDVVVVVTDLTDLLADVRIEIAGRWMHSAYAVNPAHLPFEVATAMENHTRIQGLLHAEAREEAA